MPSPCVSIDSAMSDRNPQHSNDFPKMVSVSLVGVRAVGNLGSFDLAALLCTACGPKFVTWINIAVPVIPVVSKF